MLCIDTSPLPPPPLDMDLPSAVRDRKSAGATDARPHALPKPLPESFAARLLGWRWTGLIIALGYLCMYAATSYYAIFLHKGIADAASLVPTLGLDILLVHLYTALFITGHDAMHGTVLPGSPSVNRTIGRICLFLYAGFSFDDMLKQHRRHHAHAGIIHKDPDFHAGDPRFWPWIFRFMNEYMTWKMCIQLIALVGSYCAFGAPLVNLVIFKALPGMLSAVVLFYFGTYLPHRPDSEHVERTSGFGTLEPGDGRLASFLKCMNFCCHEEHHANPGLPWWALYDAHLQQMKMATKAS